MKNEKRKKPHGKFTMGFKTIMDFKEFKMDVEYYKMLLAKTGEYNPIVDPTGILHYVCTHQMNHRKWKLMKGLYVESRT